jgi:hypothetical protein
MIFQSLSTKHGSVWDKLVGRKVSKPNAQADAKLLVQDIKVGEIRRYC